MNTKKYYDAALEKAEDMKMCRLCGANDVTLYIISEDDKPDRVNPVCPHCHSEHVYDQDKNLQKVVTHFGQTCPHIEDLEEEVRVVKESRREMKRLRDGDNELVFALAEDAGIKITADPLMPGLVWEQFHAGVMDMKRRLDRVTACGDCDPCLGGRPDQCAVMGTANASHDRAGVAGTVHGLVRPSGGSEDAG